MTQNDKKLRPVLLGLALAVICGRAQATPFAVRTAGAATVIAVDEGSIAPYGPNRSAWAYEFFHSKGGRIQIMAMHKVVSCHSRQELNLTVEGYRSDGKRVSSVAGGNWTPMLRGSNSDYILALICEGRDAAWRPLRLPTVFDAYRATWR
jgi:hypothetical protein